MLEIWSLNPLPFLNELEHLEVPGSCTVEAWLEEIWTLLCWCVRWVQLCSSLSILWHSLSLGLEWKLPFSSPVANAELSSLLAYWVQHFNSIIFRTWNSSAGVKPHPLALFLVRLPKAHLTSHFRISVSRWVTTPLWLSGSIRVFLYRSVQFSSVTQSCPTLCDSMNRSTPGLPVHHQLLEFTQTHIHWVSDAIQPSHPLSSPSPPALNLSQHQGFFQWVSSLHQVARVLEFQLQHQYFQWTPRTDLL